MPLLKGLLATTVLCSCSLLSLPRLLYLLPHGSAHSTTCYSHFPLHVPLSNAKAFARGNCVAHYHVYSPVSSSHRFMVTTFCQCQPSILISMSFPAADTVAAHHSGYNTYAITSDGEHACFM